MIFTPILLAIYGILIFALSGLPSMDQQVIDAIYSQMNILIPKFVALGYYYLPMANILFWIKAYIGVWVAVFGIKLLMRLITIMSGGIIKTDRL